MKENVPTPDANKDCTPDLENLRQDGKKAVLGWTIWGPYSVPDGNSVVDPGEGAVIYGNLNDRKTPQPTGGAAQQSQAARVPTALPGQAWVLTAVLKLNV
ncbi:hypothetical protein [Kitasatospora sp. NPDC004531]